jgi:putative FmdB family regulatory protein
MPLYEYRCTSCGHQQEFLQKLSDPPMTVCTACGKETFSKMLSAAGFQLKGSGWYATDFKGSGSKPAAKSDAKAESKSEPKSEGGDSKKDASAPSCGAGGCAACS